MDASNKKRVLVASLAFVMVISSLAILFQAPQFMGNARQDQNPGYLVGQTQSGNNVPSEPEIQAMLTLNAVLQTYPVTFTSIGLPQGTAWSVTIDGTNIMSTTYSSVTFQLTNGSHSFSVSNPTNYQASPASGVVLVYGSPVTQYVTFTLVEYELTFVETGLTAGSTWSVNLSGQIISSTTDSIMYTLANGSYNYTITGPANYGSTPSYGKAVVYGEDSQVNVSFSTTLHKVTFNFVGHTSGTSWEILFNGNAYTVSGNSLSVVMVNGLYNYSITTANEYWASPASGSVLVLNSDTSLNITIYQKTYTVTFEHHGMSVGTSWEVTLGGIAHNSTTSTITFDVPAGNYTYNVTGADGYSASANGGYINVNSQDQSVGVNFTKNPDYLTTSMLMLGGAAIGIVAGIGIGIYLIRRK